MRTFYFEATDEAGRIAKGKLEAANERTALDRLRDAGFSQIDLASDTLKDHERPPEKSLNTYSVLSCAAGLIALGLLPVLQPWAFSGGNRSMLFLLLFSISFVSAFVGFFNRHSYRSLNWISVVMLTLCGLVALGFLGLVLLHFGQK